MKKRADNTTLEDKIEVDAQGAVGNIDNLIREVQALRSSVESVVVLKPFQGIIDQSMLTNKLLGTMNSNIANLTSEIRNISISSFTKQLNKDLETTQTPINNIQQGLREIQKKLISMGDIDTAKKVKEYEYELITAKETTSIVSQQIRETGQLIEEAFDTEEVERFKNALNFEDKGYILTENLKELEQELRACGETAQANAIKEYMQDTQKETSNLSERMQELRAYIEATFGTEELEKFDNKLKSVNNTTNTVKKGFSGISKDIKSLLGIGSAIMLIRKGINFIKEANTEAVDYVETVNLFNVAMGKTTDEYGNLDQEASKYYTKAIAFQEKLSDKLGINIEESMNYQALFNSMSKSMGITSEYTYKLSENLTKLGYDLSSLYNTDTATAMEKLQSGLTGQTKPLRDFGIDITQNTLQVDLELLGIDKSISDMSQAEKVILRYISVLRQASIAHGDFAKTMDSPANQLRIFNAQITAFKRNMGSLWQGLLGNILPYVNGIMMVINELLKMVAKLFGYEVWEQDVSISTDIGADDLADDLGIAAGKAKELKNQLMGFDEINNITLPDSSNGDSSGVSVGGIDQRLLDAMKEYDNMMDKVKSKANEIKETIMKWLGFTGDTEKDLARVKNWLDKIKVTAKLILALYIGTKLLKLIGNLNILWNVFKGLKAPVTALQTGISLMGKGLLNTGKHAKGLISPLAKVTLGITGLTVSTVSSYKTMKDFAKGTIDTNEAILKLVGSVAGATISGAVLGSAFGPMGTAVGALGRSNCRVNRRFIRL